MERNGSEWKVSGREKRAKEGMERNKIQCNPIIVIGLREIDSVLLTLQSSREEGVREGK